MDDYNNYLDNVRAAADQAELSDEQRRALLNVAASMAMSGMPLPDDELLEGAEVLAGRLEADGLVARIVREIQSNIS